MLSTISKPWESKIPKPPKHRNTKRCYTMWTVLFRNSLAGGKVVWLTDRELTLAHLKYPKKIFKLVLEKDKLEEYKKYLDATIE